MDVLSKIPSYNTKIIKYYYRYSYGVNYPWCKNIHTILKPYANRYVITPIRYLVKTWDNNNYYTFVILYGTNIKYGN